MNQNQTTNQNVKQTTLLCNGKYVIKPASLSVQKKLGIKETLVDAPNRQDRWGGGRAEIINSERAEVEAAGFKYFALSSMIGVWGR